MILESNTFKNNEMMPDICSNTPKGENVSPHLSWRDVPTGIKTYSIIMEDKAIPFFPIIHWMLYNIPEVIRELPEGMNKQGMISNQIKQGKNWRGQTEYYGPNPMGGKHKYEIKLYGLNCTISEEGLDSKTFLGKYKDNVVVEQSIVGYYDKN
ncbi:YbhB/YbcL family Raf kinase inhibitor-like protein [Cellulosilyticum ruminicola]|uniref:YbhB/YbcL family Raf kinase inhibitor-like protein n=1 Tax=Cellulosilyticum ruminicola TaxID=425254 RepID=UPI0006CFE54E|nr:YbhB/YbcL family Raf kinase inhibitor-like protein [Cellulosilyticum ruminicola]